MPTFKVVETPLCFVIDESSIFIHIILLRKDESVQVYTYPVGAADYKKYRNFSTWREFTETMPKTAEAILADKD